MNPRERFRETLLFGHPDKIPLHPGVPVPDGVLRLDEIPTRDVDWNSVAEVFDDAMELVNEVLVR